MGSFILALDQGTTSSRAILFDRGGRVAAMAQAECDEKYRLWKRAVSCACGWIEKA